MAEETAEVEGGGKRVAAVLGEIDPGSELPAVDAQADPRPFGERERVASVGIVASPSTLTDTPTRGPMGWVYRASTKPSMPGVAASSAGRDAAG